MRASYIDFILGRKGDSFDGYVALKDTLNRHCYGWHGDTEVAFLQKPTFIKLIFAFVELIAPENLPMTCSICGPYPKWLGFDGVSLAMLKSNVLWDEVETIYPRNQEPEELGKDVLKHADRILLRSVHTRELLHRFCKGNPPMADEDYNLLLKSLQTECKPLAVLLSSLYERERNRSLPVPLVNFSFPGVWKDFLLLLGSNSSLAWIIRPAIVPLLIHLTQTSKYDADSNHMLNEYCPQLAAALAALPGGDLLEMHCNLLTLMVDKVKATYSLRTFVAARPPQLLKDAVDLNSAAVDKSSNSFDDLALGTEIDRLTALKQRMECQGTPLATVNSSSVLKNYTIISEKPSTLSGTFWSFPKLRSLSCFKRQDSKRRTKAVAE